MRPPGSGGHASNHEGQPQTPSDGRHRRDAAPASACKRALLGRWESIAAVVMASPVGCSNDDDTPTGDTLRAIHTTTSMASSASSTTTLPRFYEVQNGDTLTRIAETYGVPIAAIMEHNAIANPDDIRVGQILEIPPLTTTPPALTATATPTMSP